MAGNLDPDGVPLASWSPASKLVAITPNDGTDLGPSRLRGLWIGTGGNVAVLALNDTNPITIPNVPDGTQLSVMVKKVLATGTTAANIIGLA